MKITFIIAPLLLLTCVLQAQSLSTTKLPPGKKVKTIIGRCYDEGKGDTVVCFQESYDKKGNLLEHSEPLMYCSEINTYDSLNRRIQQELMCGESSGNGTYTYEYTDSTRTMLFTGAVWETKAFTLYKNGRIARYVHMQDDFGFPDKLISKTTSTTRYTYTLNNKGLLQEEHAVQTIINEDFEGGAPRCDTNVVTIVTQYSYTAFDSLEKKTIKESDGTEETCTWSYDEKTHQKTDTYYNHVNSAMPGSIYRHEQYSYDANGLLLQHLVYGYFSDTGKSNPEPDLVEEYTSGLLISSTKFYPGYSPEKLRYTYEFWE